MDSFYQKTSNISRSFELLCCIQITLPSFWPLVCLVTARSAYGTDVTPGALQHPCAPMPELCSLAIKFKRRGVGRVRVWDWAHTSLQIHSSALPPYVPTHSCATKHQTFVWTALLHSDHTAVFLAFGVLNTHTGASLPTSPVWDVCSRGVPKRAHRARLCRVRGQSQSLCDAGLSMRRQSHASLWRTVWRPGHWCWGPRGPIRDEDATLGERSPLPYQCYHVAYCWVFAVALA